MGGGPSVYLTLTLTPDAAPADRYTRCVAFTKSLAIAALMSRNFCGFRSTSGNHALHLHHDPMPTAERVAQIRHRVLDLRLPWRDRLGLRKAVAELAAEDLATRQLLVTAPVDAGRIRVGVREVLGIHIDQLHDEIGVGPGGRVDRRLLGS